MHSGRILLPCSRVHSMKNVYFYIQIRRSIYYLGPGGGEDPRRCIIYQVRSTKI